MASSQFLHKNRTRKERPPIVIDSGSYCCRAGFAGEDGPRIFFSNFVGVSKFSPQMLALTNFKSYYVGEAAKSYKNVLVFKYPVSYGFITNWDYMEKVWHHTFYNALEINPEEFPVFLTEPVLNPKAVSERMIKSCSKHSK